MDQSAWMDPKPLIKSTPPFDWQGGQKEKRRERIIKDYIDRISRICLHVEIFLINFAARTGSVDMSV